MGLEGDIPQPRHWWGYRAPEGWEPECICADCWKRNQAYGMGLTAWVCWVHGIVHPNEDGTPKPDEYAMQLEVKREAAEILRRREIADRRAAIGVAVREGMEQRQQARLFE